MKNLEITSKREIVTIEGIYNGNEFSFHYYIENNAVDEMSFLWIGEEPENKEEIGQQIVNFITKQ